MKKPKNLLKLKQIPIKFKAPIINEVGDNFVKSKGKLLMPARGPIATYFGSETSKGVMAKGTSIQTRSQAQVISPFDGSVIFVGPFRGYGNLIIIEHGKGYLSLLAGLETIDCELGQMLLAGEPGDKCPKKAAQSYMLKFEKDNKPINPFKLDCNLIKRDEMKMNQKNEKNYVNFILLYVFAYKRTSSKR